MNRHSPEYMAIWQKAIADGRRVYYDIERRATYPANPDEDTVAIAEHYRIKWQQARLLKALHHGFVVTPAELSDLTGIHPALLTMETRRLADRKTVMMHVETMRRKDGTVAYYRMTDPGNCEEIRAVIQSSWQFSSGSEPQAKGKKAA